MSDPQTLLRQALQKPTAKFRSGQEEAIRSVLEPPYRGLVVQATGWGKSIVYFIATRILRHAGKGPTLVVSPLLSLMRDQLKAAERLGLQADQYSTANKDEWENINMRLRANTIDLLLVSPERLANDDFRDLIASSSLAKTGLVVIDEAHCISDWGNDFRPDYQRIGELIRKLPPTTAVLATTATANNRVIADIQQQIGTQVKVLRGPLTRKSLRLQVAIYENNAERLAWLADHLDELPGSGIIYALTQDDTERVANWLSGEGFGVAAYHAGLPSDHKLELEDKLLRNEVKALVATVALGMGFDKSDLGFVVHYQSPGNLVAYYQQIGRAGRAIPDAIAILFMGHEDQNLHEWFINSARPSEKEISVVLSALSDGPLSVAKLTENLNISKGAIEKVLKTLSVLSRSPIIKVGNSYQLTPVQYVYNQAKEEALKSRRKEERERFVNFAKTKDCLMMIVAKELDDPTAVPCKKCANCVGGEIVSSKIAAATLARAVAFLGQGEIFFEPRKRWQANAFPIHGFKGNINIDSRCEVGICLSKWGGTGIATWVKADKVNGYFRDSLVRSTIDTIRSHSIYSQIEWICAVPSLRSTDLVPDFARRVAQGLGIEYVDAVQKMKPTAQQKSQQNSFHQANNLDGAFRIREVRQGSVLLIDDMVDSRWTFTVIGALLRTSGSGPVVPFALCSTTTNGDDDV